MADQERTRLDPALLRLAGVLIVGLLAAALDTTMVNVGIDKISEDLRVPISTTQWVTTGYLLSYAMVIPTVGWATARVGARRLWIGSLALFFASSLLCGIAWNIGSLTAFRILQGAGGGMMLVLFQSLLAQAAGPRQLPRLMGVVAIPTLLAPILGPILGGVIVSSLSWRWIFYVNVPVCAVALVLAVRTLPNSERGPVPRLDVRGLVLLGPSLAAVIYGLSRAGRTGSFTAPSVVIPVLAGLALLVLFTLHAARTDAPVIDLRLLRRKTYACAMAVSFLMGAGIFATLLILPLYYQQGRHQNALHAGLHLAPQGLGFLIGLVATRLTDRISPRTLVVGGIVLTVFGTVAYTQVSHHPNEALLFASLVVRGAGTTAATIPALSVVYRGLTDAQIPDATVSQRISQQLGASFGTAILAVILQRQLTHSATQPLLAFDRTFWWTLAFSAVAVIPALLLPGDVERAAPTQPVEL